MVLEMLIDLLHRSIKNKWLRWTAILIVSAFGIFLFIAELYHDDEVAQIRRKAEIHSAMSYSSYIDDLGEAGGMRHFKCSVEALAGEEEDLASKSGQRTLPQRLKCDLQVK